MYLIPAFSFFRHSGFVSGSTSLLPSINQMMSSSCSIHREFAFSRRPESSLSFSLHALRKKLNESKSVKPTLRTF